MFSRNLPVKPMPLLMIWNSALLTDVNWFFKLKNIFWPQMVLLSDKNQVQYMVAVPKLGDNSKKGGERVYNYNSRFTSMTAPVLWWMLSAWCHHVLFWTRKQGTVLVISGVRHGKSLKTYHLHFTTWHYLFYFIFYKTGVFQLHPCSWSFTWRVAKYNCYFKEPCVCMHLGMLVAETQL